MTLPIDEARESYRERLLAAAEAAAFPGEKVVEPQTGRLVWSAEDAAAIRAVLDLYGVAELDPEDDDVDKVVNTVCTLSIEVGAHLLAIHAAGGDPGALGAHDWHADYADYLAALWRGDVEAIAACARRLNIAAGIPNGSAPLAQGPISQA